MMDDTYDFDTLAPSKIKGELSVSRSSKAKGGPRRDGAGRGGGYLESHPAEEKRGKERITKEVIQASRQSEDDRFIDVPVQEPVHMSHRMTNERMSQDEEDEYGDDDFEEYGDDFEDDEPSPEKIHASMLIRAPAPAPTPAPAPAKVPVCDHREAKTRTSTDEGNTMSQKQEQLVLEQGGSSTGSKTGSSRNALRKTKQFGDVKISLNLGSFGSSARAKRLAKLQVEGLVDMQIEQFTNFFIPAGSQPERYRRLLKAQSPTIRQFGVPADDDSRSVEVATEDLALRDQSVQFSYGDDTDLLEIISIIKQRKLAQKPITMHAQHQLEGLLVKSRAREQNTSATGMGYPPEEGQEFLSDSTHLVVFLQRASQVCERLMEEENLRRGGEVKRVDRSSAHRTFFREEMHWTNLSRASSGAHELIRTRPATSVRFSIIQPHLLVSTHPHVANEDEDLLPCKALFCVWDSQTKGAPLVYVLTSAGCPTCCTFSSTQTFLLLGGTAEGSLHLWDLREASRVHKDRDAVDLGIENGVRKPCFSTPVIAAMEEMGVGEDQHAAPITQIEAIGESSAASGITIATSQFATLDSSGLICLWVTTNSPQEGDIGLSPWSRVSITVTRALRVQPHVGMGAGISATSHLAAVPGDDSSLLAAAPRGVVNKIVRFGEAPSPNNLERQEDRGVEIKTVVTSRAGTEGMSFYSDVTCISARQATDDNLTEQPILVGRSDGTIDLFQMNVSAPLQTWSMDQVLGRESSSNTSVLLVRWLPNKPASFVAIDVLGNILLFDLLLDPHSPVCKDVLPGPFPSRLPAPSGEPLVDLSGYRPGSSSARAAFINDQGHVNVRPVWDGWVEVQKVAKDDLLVRLAAMTGQWSLRTANREAKAVFK